MLSCCHKLGVPAWTGTSNTQGLRTEPKVGISSPKQQTLLAGGSAEEEELWLEDDLDFLSLWDAWVGGWMEQEEQWQRLALHSRNSLGGTRKGLPHCWLAQPRDAQPAFAA